MITGPSEAWREYQNYKLTAQENIKIVRIFAIQLDKSNIRSSFYIV